MNQPFVLDTSVIIDVLRGRAAAKEWLASMTSIPVCSEVTRTEVLRVVRSPERAPTERLLQALRWAPVDERVSRDAGELGRRFRRSHAHIGVADLLIAATCLSLDAALATMNVRHFPMFESLARPYDG